MRFDLHLRGKVKESIDCLAGQMHAWDAVPKVDPEEQERLKAAIRPFKHCVVSDRFRIAGVDGSGDFPSVTYADSFVYLALAQSVEYETCQKNGLRELGPITEPIVNFAWIPEEIKKRRQNLLNAFAQLAGSPIREIIERGDYRQLRYDFGGHRESTSTILERLILPHASETNNIGIQLRSCGELGAAARLLMGNSPPEIVLVDTTLSLPTLGNKGTLFFEHLKRWCCWQARQKGVVFAALSKSHGLPGMGLIEELAKQVLASDHPGPAEHWYLRLPASGIDDWESSLSEGRSLPPVGAVSYLVRFHRTTAVLRLDMDRQYWLESVKGANRQATESNEEALFERLDYACHDQRCYGYPYPIKAAHDRASLTKEERIVLRKQIIDAAVRMGMRRNLFRDASQATGHA